MDKNSEPMSLPVPVLDYTLSEDEMDTCPEPLPLEDFCVDRVICNNIDEWYALIVACKFLCKFAPNYYAKNT